MRRTSLHTSGPLRPAAFAPFRHVPLSNRGSLLIASEVSCRSLQHDAFDRPRKTCNVDVSRLDEVASFAASIWREHGEPTTYVVAFAAAAVLCINAVRDPVAAVCSSVIEHTSCGN